MKKLIKYWISWYKLVYWSQWRGPSRSCSLLSILYSFFVAIPIIRSSSRYFPSLLPYFHFVLNYFLYSSLFQLGKKITWLIQIQCFHSLGTEWGKIYCPISKPMSYTNHYFLYLIFQYFHNGFPQHGAILFLQHWDEQDKHLATNLLFRGNGLSKKYPQSCRETRNQCICWLYISQSFHSSSNNSNLAFLGAT